MKILHTADTHLGELSGPKTDQGQNARMIDIVNCMGFLAEKAQEEKPDLIIHSGDLTHESKIWADDKLMEIEYAAAWFKKLAKVAPVVLILGTLNHDNLKAFINLSLMDIPNLHVVTEPKLLNIKVFSGEMIQVGCIPGYDKNHFRAMLDETISPEAENEACSKILGDIILGLSAQLDKFQPSVLAAHYTLIGAEMDSGKNSVFMKSDVVLPADAIAASWFNLVCLGHIHKAQQVINRVPAFYSGSINGLSFNEENQDKGFYIHSLTRNNTNNFALDSKFIKTPYRKFKTIRVTDWGGKDYALWINDDVKDSIVRVLYTVTEEESKIIDRNAIEEELYRKGAFWVAEIKPEKIISGESKGTIDENDDPIDNLVKWAESEGIEPDQITRLVEKARPLLATLAANKPSGKFSGLFMPKRITVKNYRSYLDETFDFNPVHFAIVNGKNGVGKSSLFMDAVSDCLFEEIRESKGKDKVGIDAWINNKAQFGTIVFEFSMGETDWRVSRSRSRNGKTTLALDQFVDGAWESRSDGQKKDDIQQNIIDLLGMDANTFQCVAVIMQEGYGLFLEADKMARMQVIANILGLGVYEEARELAAEQGKTVKTEIETHNTRLSLLSQELDLRVDVDMEHDMIQEKITEVQKDIEIHSTKREEENKILNQFKSDLEKVTEVESQINALNSEILEKSGKKLELENQIKEGNLLIEKAGEIAEGAEKLENFKKSVIELEAKSPRAVQLIDLLRQVRGDIEKIDQNIADYKTKMDSYYLSDADREELRLAVAEYETQKANLMEFDKQKDKFYQLTLGVSEARQKWIAEVNKRCQLETTLNNEVKALETKTKILENSNCIDLERAACGFLADAKKALIELDEKRAALAAINRDSENILEKEYKDLENECNAIGYDSIKHNSVKESVESYRVKAEKAGKIGEIENQHAQYQDLYVVETGRKIDFKERLDKLQGEMELLNAELAALNEFKQKVSDYAHYQDEKEKLGSIQQVLGIQKEQIATLNSEIEAKLIQLNGLNGVKKGLLERQSLVIDQEKKIGAIDLTLRNSREQLDNYNIELGKIKSRLAALDEKEKEADSIREKLKPLAAEVSEWAMLVKSFGIDGIPFMIVKSVIPELSEASNRILWDMTGGSMSLDIRDQRVQKSSKQIVNALEVFVTDSVRGTLPYISRSGGQRVKAAIAFVIALADLKARRAGIKLGMLFIDEPPYLDDEGKKGYCDALELLAGKYAEMKVIAISHENAFKARFPQIIDVSDEGESGSKARLLVS